MKTKTNRIKIVSDFILFQNKKQEKAKMQIPEISFKTKKNDSYSKMLKQCFIK